MGDYSGLPVHYYRLAENGIIIPGGENKPQMTILVVDGYWGLRQLEELRSVLVV
ncbi:hypothetical protein [uncultured Vagococcus sp.]|uniref:hypothetical protein n=1 Tax=uncultured Vagococcus sp. TaxID=189676 RepID=UPI0028D6CA5B|nr:hypothetical protein [uncultured Vagococcus sp.]